MVAESHRLRCLQVGEARHDGVGVFGCQAQNAFLQFLQQLQNGVNLIAHIQADVGCHLVVAAAAGMQLLAGDADALGQARLNVHVHIFKVNAPFEIAGLNFRFNGVQAADNVIAFLRGEHAHFRQHRCMRN